jgi:hypothetical protein
VLSVARIYSIVTRRHFAMDMACSTNGGEEECI